MKGGTETMNHLFPVDLDAGKVVSMNAFAGASGSAGQRLLAANMDSRALRPYINHEGQAVIALPTGGMIAANDGSQIQELKEVPVGNATLQKEEWLQFDTAVRDVARVRLPFVQMLRSRGLVFPITNPLGTTVLQWQDVSDMNDAEMNMDAITRTSNDRLDFGDNYLPLPIVMKQWHLNIRALSASRTSGQALDVQQARVSTIKVAEFIENMFINGASSYTFGNGTIYGITDHPNVNSYTLSGEWDASSTTGGAIISDVLGMKQASIDAKHYGPWTLCVPTEYETTLDDDHKSESERTIRERILAIEGIEQVMVVDKLAAGKVVLIELMADTIEAVVGMDPRPVEWSTEGGLVSHYKTMAIIVPRIRPDQRRNRCWTGTLIGTCKL
jgi:hypothetical protein